MNWIGENFCSTAKAWNTLCDAIEERIEAYKIADSANIVIPRHTAAPSKWKFDFAAMRELIRRLLQVSFPVLYFDKWVKFSYDDISRNFAVGSDFFEELGIDSYAFFRRAPEDVPSLRHTVSQFIFNAAKIINDACIYPAPSFSSSAEKAGFMLDADLILECFEPEYEKTGKVSTDSYLSYYSAAVGANLRSMNDILVYFALGHDDNYDPIKGGRTRSKNHRWIYHKAGELTDNGRSVWNYIAPVFKGSCGLRSPEAYVSYTDIDPDKHDMLTKKINMDFTVDFAVNRATEKVDLSSVQSVIDRFWNLDEKAEKISYIARLEDFSPEIYLSESNYPDFKSKYKYFTDKTA